MGNLTATGTVTVGASQQIFIDGANQCIKVFGTTVVVATDINDWLDWAEGGVSKSVSLTPGTYTCASLAAHTQTQMRAISTASNWVHYTATTRKISIYNTTSTSLKLLWSTGTHTASTCGRALGFDVSATDTGATRYVADYQTALRVELGLLS